MTRLISCSTVFRSKLEASSVSRNPHEASYASLLEKVQKTFLRFLYLLENLRVGTIRSFTRLSSSSASQDSRSETQKMGLGPACLMLRGSPDCPELVTRVVLLFAPPLSQSRFNFRPRSRDISDISSSKGTLSVPQKFPLLRASRSFNSLLASTPDAAMCLLVPSWKTKRSECMKFCEAKDDCPSSLFFFWFFIFLLFIVIL